MGAIYVQKDGQQYGPLTRDELQPYLDAGVLSVEDWAVEEGGAEWVPLGNLLRAAVAAEDVAVIPEAFREQTEIKVDFETAAEPVPGAMADVSSGRKKIAVAVIVLGMLGGGTALGFYFTQDTHPEPPPPLGKPSSLADLLKTTVGDSSPQSEELPPLELPATRPVPLPLPVNAGGDFQKAAEAAKAGHPVGAFHLAVRLHEGWGGAPHASQAVTNAELSEANNNGPAAAKIFLGFLYMNSRTPPAKLANVPKLFTEKIEKAAKAEAARPDPYAHYVLGLRELPTRGYRGDLPRALHHFAAAGRAGFPPALYQLGQLHLRGMGVPRNPRKATEYFAAAGQAGHTEALRLLGLMYLRGDGLAPNPAESVRLTEAAARIGNPSAQFGMAVLLDQGKITDANQTAACQWFMLAAMTQPTAGQHVLRLKNQLTGEEFQMAVDLAKVINPEVAVPDNFPTPPGITKPAESGLAPLKVEPKVPKTTPAKLIADPIVEHLIRELLGKPQGELTETDLEKVDRLYCFRERITDEGLKDVAKLQNLGSLFLGKTKITDAGLKEVAKLQKLEDLHLDSTEIADAGLKDVAKLWNLESLSLANTKITDAGFKEVAKLQKLENLFLNDTQITDEGLKDVAKLRQLKYLNLGNTQITDVGFKEVAKLQKLESLYLGDTQITDEGLKDVAKLQNLTVLNMHKTKITDTGLKELVKLRKLEGLHLYGCKQVTKAGVAELKKALQNCKIFGP